MIRAQRYILFLKIRHFCHKNNAKTYYQLKTTDCTSANSLKNLSKLFVNKIKIAIFAPYK